MLTYFTFTLAKRPFSAISPTERKSTITTTTPDSVNCHSCGLNTLLAIRFSVQTIHPDTVVHKWHINVF